MNDEELEQAIEGILSDDTGIVSCNGDELLLYADTTPDEIVAIAELLKKEGRV